MGDMFSSRKTTTSNQTINEQVGLSGAGQIGRIVAGGDVQNTITVTDGSDIAIYASRDIGLEAMRLAGQVTEQAQNAFTVGTDRMARVAGGAFDVADSALTVADRVNTQSLNAVTQTLSAMRDLQRDSSATIGMAVESAQQTALLATPQSPAAYAEIMAGQQQDTVKYVVGAIILGTVIYFALRK